MAKAPIFQPGSVQRRALPGVRLSAGAGAASFGGTEAQQLSRLGNALNQITDVAAQRTIASQEETNKSLARDDYNNASIELKEWFETDLFNRKGVNAVEAYKAAQEKIEEIRSSFASKSGNERQSQLFNASYDALSVRYLGSAIDFQERERKALKVATVEAGKLRNVELAVANRTREDLVLLLAIENANETIVLLKEQGASDEIIDRAVAQSDNLIFSEVLDALIVDSPTAALAFYEENKEFFLPTTRDGIEKNLGKQSEVEVISNAVLAISSSGPTEFKDQIKEARKLPAGIRDKVIKGLNEARRIDNIVLDTEQQKLIDGEKAKLESLPDPRNYIIPKWLPIEAIKEIEQYRVKFIEEEAYAVGAGPAPVTDWALHAEIMSLSPQALSERNLFGDMDSLAIDQYKQVTNLQRDSRINIEKSRGKEANKVRTTYQQLQASVKNSKYFSTPHQKGKNLPPEWIEQREGRYYEAAAKHLALIPPNEQTTERIEKMIREDLLAPVWIDRTFPKANFNIKRFEVPFLSDLGFGAEEEAFMARQPVPASLEIFVEDGLGYSSEANVYFRDVKGDTVRRTYDVLTGEYIESFRLVPEQQDNVLEFSVGG